jgi:hypothetical protein
MDLTAECAFEELAELEPFGVFPGVHLVCKRKLLVVVGRE